MKALEDKAMIITLFADEEADLRLSALLEFILLVQDQRPEPPDFWPRAFPYQAALLSDRCYRARTCDISLDFLILTHTECRQHQVNVTRSSSQTWTRC